MFPICDKPVARQVQNFDSNSRWVPADELAAGENHDCEKVDVQTAKGLYAFSDAQQRRIDVPEKSTAPGVTLLTSSLCLCCTASLDQFLFPLQKTRRVSKEGFARTKDIQKKPRSRLKSLLSGLPEELVRLHDGDRDGELAFFVPADVAVDRKLIRLAGPDA